MGEGNIDYEFTPKGENGEWKYLTPKSYGEITYNNYVRFNE